MLNGIEQVQEYIKELQFQETELRSDAGRLQSCLADTRSYLASEREKFTDLTGKVKNRERIAAKLQQQLESESNESDYLITKNGEIAEVNIALKKDLSLSEKHLNSIIKNNQQLKE